MPASPHDSYPPSPVTNPPAHVRMRVTPPSASKTTSPRRGTQRQPNKPRRSCTAQDGFTIDELARRAGVTTRNIRAYHSKGLLPPPRLVGRTGYYEARHLHRLAAISRLLERGFSLASIRSLLADWEQGCTLSDALGLQEATTDAEKPVVTREELDRLFPEFRGDARLLERAVKVGLFEVDGNTITAPNPLLIEVGVQLTRAGVPLPVALRAFEQLVQDLRPAAARYVTILLERVGGEESRSGRVSPELAERLSSLVPAARVAVASTFARELRSLLTEAISGLGKVPR